ncbi:MAG: DUF4097 domain-containing protein [Dehalococcoidia bacterium]
MSDFQVPIAPAAELNLRTASGAISVQAEARDDLLVTVGVVKDSGDGRIQIRGKKPGAGKIVIRCPIGTDLSIGTASGRVELLGSYGRVNVTSASSTITLDRAEETDLRSASGAIKVGRCEGRCRVMTKSSRITVGFAGSLDISTVSGRVTVLGADGPLRVHSVSGRLDIGCLRAVDANVKTMSAPVTLRLPGDVRPDAVLKAVSGKTSCDCPRGSDCTLEVRTVSGRIEVKPA